MMRRRSFLSLSLLALASSFAAHPLLAAPEAPKPLFLLTYRAGPAWIAGQPMQRQKLRGHMLYMQRLLREKRLVAGGPFDGEDAGMAIVRADSLAEARAILAADPAILSGVFTGTVTGWTPMIDSGKPLAS